MTFGYDDTELTFGELLERLADQLTAADWLTDAALTDTQLTGQLTERVLPLTCPLPPARTVPRGRPPVAAGAPPFPFRSTAWCRPG